MSDTQRFDSETYLSRRRSNEAKLAAAGVYAPEMEHDACGVGFVAARDGKPTRAVVDAAIEALQAIWHRGAVDADGMTGDGAGNASMAASTTARVGLPSRAATKPTPQASCSISGA